MRLLGARPTCCCVRGMATACWRDAGPALLLCCCRAASTVLVCQLPRPPWWRLAFAAALQHMQHIQLTLPVPAGPDHKHGPPVLVRVLRSIYLACAELCCYLLHRQAQQPAAQQHTATRSRPCVWVPFLMLPTRVKLLCNEFASCVRPARSLRCLSALPMCLPPGQHG